MAYATTGGFESVCEAMYMQKPVLMVPAHIEQECNVMDAIHSGAGVGASNFELSMLNEFSPNYRPDVDFNAWCRSAESIYLFELENLTNSRKVVWANLSF
jgi:hypothetical protein